MKNFLAFAAALLALASAIPYIVDVIRGKTHPNIVTWITWTLVNVVTALATYRNGDIQTALLAASATLGTLIITILGLKFGVRKYTAFDIFCQALALLGIVVWLAAGSATAAVAISQTVILIAALPTWRHAWKSPWAETWEGFAMGGVAAIMTLISLSAYSFTSLASPIIFVLNSIIVVSIVLGRRRLRHLRPAR